MSVIIPITAAADAVAATSTSAQFATALDTTGVPGEFLYVFCANTDSWIAQGSSPTASAGAGSCFIPTGATVYLDGTLGSHVSVIRDSADGLASLTPISTVR